MCNCKCGCPILSIPENEQITRIDIDERKLYCDHCARCMQIEIELATMPSARKAMKETKKEILKLLSKDLKTIRLNIHQLEG